jgi:hypothetical protein
LLFFYAYHKHNEVFPSFEQRLLFLFEHAHDYTAMLFV